MKIWRNIIVIMVFTIPLLHVNANNTPRITNGTLDLSSSTVADISPIKLQGECEFYWNKLLAPSDFQDEKNLPKPLYVKIPQSWTSYKIDGAKLPSTGFATYRFFIRKKPAIHAEMYGLQIPSVFSSYKLWVNDELLAEVGEVGTNKNNFYPKFKYQIVPIHIDPKVHSEKIEVVIQVSNYSHRRAGLPWPIHFGNLEELTASSRWMDIINLIIIGIILVIGINHLNMYLFRRKDRSNLYFGILCLVMIIRNITTGDRILGFIFENMSWELMVKLDNFSGFGTIPLFALFFYNQYKDDFPAKLKNTILVVGIIISLIVFTTPAMFFGKFRMIFELYILFGGLYLTFGVLLISAIRKRPYALQAFIGMFILYSTAINDVLSSMGVIQTAYIAPYGLVTFMILQSVVITSKSAKAINENENLSYQLSLEKQSLEKNIEERTHELREQQNILLEHQEKEKLQSWLNEGLAEVNEVLSKNKNDYKVLSQKVLSTLVKRMDVKYGVLYVLNEEEYSEPYLQMVANFGCSKETQISNAQIPTDSGLIGSTFTDNQIQLITNIPENYVKISSGLGESVPKSLLIVPLSTDEAVYGVVELASFGEFKPIEIEFIKKIAFSIATNLNTVRMNERNVNLIQQFQEQGQNIQEKDEQMRLNLEELEYLREQYEELKQKFAAMESSKKTESED